MKGLNDMKAMEYKGQKVITTAMLAEAYGTSTSYISKNFSRNKSKFVEGKHYFYLEGKEFKNFVTSSLKDEWSKEQVIYICGLKEEQTTIAKFLIQTKRGNSLKILKKPISELKRQSMRLFLPIR